MCDGGQQRLRGDLCRMFIINIIIIICLLVFMADAYMHDGNCSAEDVNC